ncbi:MAG: mechanosensitive ion channel family protein, partial [Kiritimatiellia bacterium]|nr:mechanosensitive ion channel family protein [Kiritimatiellia bacterium]
MDGSWFSIELAGHALWRLVALALALLAALVIGRALHALLIRYSRKMEESNRPIYGAAVRAVDGAVGLLSVVAGLRIGISFLSMSERVQGIVSVSFGVLVTATVAWALYLLVDVLDRWLTVRANRTASKLDDMLVPLVRKTLRITIVLLALIQVATTLSDKPITSLIAGLGVGSLAIALAAQDTIKNFFGSLVILSDKPFELGERIKVEGIDGTAESVGFRSTRIRTLEGHLVTIPNGDMANRIVENLSKRPRLRRLFNVTIPYDTPPEKVRRARDLLLEILRDHEGMDPAFPPRVVFNAFNADSLNLLVIYWYNP